MPSGAIRLITGVARCSMAGLWMTGLFFRPVHTVVSPVADGSANPETVQPCAEVAPVGQRRFRDPDECRHLRHRHQLVVGVGEFSMQGVRSGASCWFSLVRICRVRLGLVSD